MNYLLGKPISLHLIGALLVAVFPVVHAAEDWTVPRTEFGQPDLQGVWYYGTGTDFERQEALGTQQSYTESEALAVAQSLQAIDTAKAQQLDPGRAAPTAGVPVAGNADLDFATTRVNMVRINGEYRTSQIVSPANGRWPYREGGLDFFEKLQVQGFGAFDGPEIRPASERCAGPTGARCSYGWLVL